jgi:hypothetical protein
MAVVKNSMNWIWKSKQGFLDGTADGFGKAAVVVESLGLVGQ